MFGRQDALISGPTVESAKEQAFERVRQWAPCRIQVIGEAFEEWLLGVGRRGVEASETGVRG